MSILFVATVYRHLVNFHIPYMLYFQKQGYAVYAISSVDEDRQVLMDLGIKCIDVRFSRNPFSLSNLQAYRELKTLFKQKQFELIHVHTPIAALLTRFAYRKYEKPIVYTVQGFHFFKGAPLQNWLIYYPLEKVAASWTDHLFVMNDEDYKNAKRFISTEKLSFVHGVGVEFTKEQTDLAALRESLQLGEDSIVISYIAELNSNKNHQYLLRNWNVIKRQCPEAVLLIIGTGELNQVLRNYVEVNELKDIRFLGHRRDVEHVLQITHINTLLSHREGLPKSTIESMFMSLPNIVANTRGLRDLIENEKNGFVIPQNADEQLVERFVDLIQSEKLRNEMGQYAKQMVKPYLLENVLPEYSKVYKNFLK